MSENRTVHYVIYDADGKIRQSGDCELAVLSLHADLFGPGHEVMEVSDEDYRADIDAHCYVRDGIVTPKEHFDVPEEITIQADGTDIAAFDVPENTWVICDGDLTRIDDKRFEFATDALGDYPVYVQMPPPFYSFEVVIHAV